MALFNNKDSKNSKKELSDAELEEQLNEELRPLGLDRLDFEDKKKFPPMLKSCYNDIFIKLGGAYDDPLMFIHHEQMMILRQLLDQKDKLDKLIKQNNESREMNQKLIEQNEIIIQQNNESKEMNQKIINQNDKIIELLTKISEK